MGTLVVLTVKVVLDVPVKDLVRELAWGCGEVQDTVTVTVTVTITITILNYSLLHCY